MSPDSPAHPSGDTHLHDAAQRWVAYGQPALYELLTAMSQSVTLDPMVHTLVYRLFGQYLHTFSKEFARCEEVADSHFAAMTALMADPVITAQMESMMKQQVGKRVEGLIE